MAREGLREGQVSFYWGNKTQAEINAIPTSDIREGDIVYNTNTKQLLYFQENKFIVTGTDVLSTIDKASIRQTVNTGPVDVNGRADFLEAGTGLVVNTKDLDTYPLLFTIGDGFEINGRKDYCASINTNISLTGLMDNTINYFYISFNPITSTATFGHTTVAPVYSYARPGAASTGLYWYPIDHRKCGELGDGVDWADEYRVYVGQAVTSGGAVTSVTSYPYQQFGRNGLGEGYADAGLKEAMNAGGLPPLFACRAWVNFNGTGTVAIRDSGNVSSITDNGVGNYTVNFAVAMPDVNYAYGGSSSRSIDRRGVFGVLSAPQTTSITIGTSTDQTGYVVATNLDDHQYVSVSIFR